MNPRQGGGMRGLRTLLRDDSVKNQKVAKGTWRRIARFSKPYKKPLAVFMAAIILDAAVSAANPLVYREIIDGGILNKDVRLIVELALVVVALSIGDALLTFVQRYVSAKIGEGLIYDMRTKVFDHIQRMPLAFFTRTQTGALVSRLNNDVLAAQEAFTDVLSNVIGNFISVALVLVIMFILSWQLTLVSLILLPFFVIPARFFGRRLQAITRESYELNAKMNTTMIERFNVSGALLAKIFGDPKAEQKTFAERAGRVRDIGVTQATYARFLFTSLLLTASLATAIVYGWGGDLAVRGALNVGTVVALTAYLNRLYGPLTSMSNINVDLLTTLVSFERVFEILDLEPLIREKSDAVAIPSGPVKIEFKNVNFRYPKPSEVSLASLETVATVSKVSPEQVLFDVSFVAKPGSLVALVGHSGAGKTTISQLVARLYDVNSGSVSLNGVDLRDATFESLRARIGMVTQDSHLFHESIRDNLLYAKPSATEKELIEALRGAQILDLVQSLPEKLNTMVGERGYRLSGGEKQRLALARVLLKQPDLVVLDEATAHLDSESELAIQKALQVALKGRTSLVIAHRLSTIRGADQILVLEKGRIIQRGKHEELLKEGGLYADLYKTQFAPKQQ
jgi:ATP-binding cassette subfamily B protein